MDSPSGYVKIAIVFSPFLIDSYSKMVIFRSYEKVNPYFTPQNIPMEPVGSRNRSWKLLHDIFTTTLVYVHKKAMENHYPESR